MVLVRRVLADEPPMSAEAFEAGRRRLLESLPEPEHRWRRVVHRLWWVVLLGMPVALAGLYFLDLQVYRNGGLAWLQGLPLYVDFPGALGGPALPFTYPPIAAVMFSGLAVMPVWLMKMLVIAASFLALSAVCVVVMKKLSHRKELVWTAGPAAALVALALEPVYSTIHFGQINLVLMALVVIDCFVVRDPRWRGLLIGLAAAIKLTPAVFVLYFLVRREWRSAANAFAAFVVLGVAGFFLAPSDSVQYWFHALADPSRIGGLAFTTNQSLRGFLHRLSPGEGTESLLWLGCAALVMAMATFIAWRTRDDLVAVLAIAAGGLLASPVSWSHHWVWCVPAFMLVATRLRRWWEWTLFGTVIALFCTHPFTMMPNTGNREMHWTFWEHLPGNVYVWVAVVALTVLCWRRGQTCLSRMHIR